MSEQVYVCTKCGWIGPESECDYWEGRGFRWCGSRGCNYAVETLEGLLRKEYEKGYDAGCRDEAESLRLWSRCRSWALKCRSERRLTEGALD